MNVANPGSTQSEPLLKVVDLTFKHVGQPQPTLQGVHLTLNPGELVVLAGATGSGKSTLLNGFDRHCTGAHRGKPLRSSLLPRSGDNQLDNSAAIAVHGHSVTKRRDPTVYRSG